MYILCTKSSYELVIICFLFFTGMQLRSRTLRNSPKKLEWLPFSRDQFFSCLRRRIVHLLKPSPYYQDVCIMRNSEVSVGHCNIQTDTGKTIPMLHLVKAKSNLPSKWKKPGKDWISVKKRSLKQLEWVGQGFQNLKHSNCLLPFGDKIVHDISF